MREIKKHSFFLVIPTRERKEHLLNLLEDLNGFSDYISQCIVVDQSEKFIGDDFDCKSYSFPLIILKGDISKGVNHSRNMALEKYKEEDWLFFLDDDLRVEKTELKKIPFFLSHSSINVLVMGCNEARQDNKEKAHSDMLNIICKPKNISDSRMRLQVSSGLSIVDKYYFKKSGFFFDETFTFWGDDWDFGFRLLNSGALIQYYPEINFTHLEIPFGGQRGFKEKINVERKRKYLELYFYKKHFGNSVLKQKVLIDFVMYMRKVNLIGIFNLCKYYLNLKYE